MCIYCIYIYMTYGQNFWFTIRSSSKMSEFPLSNVRWFRCNATFRMIAPRLKWMQILKGPHTVGWNPAAPEMYQTLKILISFQPTGAGRMSEPSTVCVWVFLGPLYVLISKVAAKKIKGISRETIWMFPKIGGFSPQNGWWKFHGKPYEQMDDLGIPLSLERPIWQELFLSVWKKIQDSRSVNSKGFQFKGVSTSLGWHSSVLCQSYSRPLLHGVLCCVEPSNLGWKQRRLIISACHSEYPYKWVSTYYKQSPYPHISYIPDPHII